jgi:hypothetical protein
MEKEKKKSYLADLLGLPEGAEVKFDPNDNTLLSSKIIDDNGNTNLFRIIIDKDAPFIGQRIYQNDNRQLY